LVARRLNDAALMSVDQAARHLEIKQQVAYDLLRHGFLQSVVDETGVLRGRRITHDAIADFRSKYVPLTEVARARCMGMRRALVEIPVRPVCGPKVDGTRQYFYLREEVMGLYAASHAVLERQPGRGAAY
jgi:hypothetical protein